ncbi:hypothetical protein BIW11_05726 [Tropilaelaps mercedesae]|uniref:Uncharacterized protein n=1 Tax=Tropilaelaps mercedesae TaxID=418985 RepID=A0A1V9Y161_9ACAR|nr:hypothetical protein BIW11_05726 [Tropilaelaps mercedesae]
MAQLSTPMPPLRQATCWRMVQICLYLTSLACSIGTLIGYKGVNALFDNDMASCILNATVVVADKDNSQNCSLSLERMSEYTCKFVYFDVICSVVYSIIGCWFFIACTVDAKTRPDETIIQAWKLVVPSIFFTTVLFLLCIVSSSFISKGITAFNESLTLQSSKFNCLRFKLSNHPAVNATTFIDQVGTLCSVAETFSWLCAVSFFLGIVILTSRCCVAADFDTDGEVNVLERLPTRVTDCLKAALRRPMGALTNANAINFTRDTSRISEPITQTW